MLILPRVSRHGGSFEERTGRLVWSTKGRPHHDAFTDRTVLFCSLLFFFVVVNVMDAVTTLYGTARMGWASEGNPLLRWIGGRFGAGGFLVYKTLGVIMVVSGLWLMHRGFSRAAAASRSARSRRVFSGWRGLVEVSAVALSLFFSWAVWNNLVLIAKLG